MDIESILLRFPKRREYVLEILHEVQNNHPQKYLTKESIKEVAKYLNLPLSQIHGLIGYYTMLKSKPQGRYVISICKSPVCNLMGSQSLIDFIKTYLSIDINETTNDGMFTLNVVECLGRCDSAPSIMIGEQFYSNLTKEGLMALLDELKQKK